MPIDFSEERWTEVAEDARLWWAGELGRPLIQIRLTGRDPGRPEPPIPAYSRATTAYRWDEYSAEQIIDRHDWDLSRVEFLGDAFPRFWSDFGPGALATMIGGEAEIATGTVWFHPPERKEPAELSFRYDPDCDVARRLRSLYRAGVERWGDAVQLAMTDLGGAVDVLSTFRPSETLLLDLYDCPDEVERLTWEVHEAWWAAWGDFERIRRPGNRGYSAWSQIYSPDPYYMLQCDFAYMIGPEMFDRFVRPEIAACCGKLVNGFYHLDGVGQLAHLDSLLRINDLAGVQWVPGDGQPPQPEWPDVYRRLIDAGVKTQTWGDFDTLDRFAETLPTVENMVIFLEGTLEDRDRAEALLERYGA